MDAAANRAENCGARAGEDYRSRGHQDWMKHTVISASRKDGHIIHHYRATHNCPLANEIQYIAPEARVYEEDRKGVWSCFTVEDNTRGAIRATGWFIAARSADRWDAIKARKRNARVKIS